MLLNDKSQIEQNVKKSGSSFYWGNETSAQKKKKEQCLLFTPFAEKLMI